MHPSIPCAGRNSGEPTRAVPARVIRRGTNKLSDQLAGPRDDTVIVRQNIRNTRLRGAS
jgi:hypothetical protein